MAAEIRRKGAIFGLHLCAALGTEPAGFVLSEAIFSKAVELGRLAQSFASIDIIGFFRPTSRVSLKVLPARRSVLRSKLSSQSERIVLRCARRMTLRASSFKCGSCGASTR
jgi:hypothetical protein